MGKKQIPLEIIQAWLKDPDWRVRQAALVLITSIT